MPFSHQASETVQLLKQMTPHFIPVFENTYFSFFFRFQKTWLFTFFEMAL